MTNPHGRIPAEIYKRLFNNLPPCNPERLNNDILANLMRDDAIRIPAGIGSLYAGLTYLGQFIDHDLTLEDMTNLNTPGIVDVNTLVNKRTSWFDLDCVYGKSNQFAFSITSNQTNADLRTLAINAGWNQSSLSTDHSLRHIDPESLVNHPHKP